MNLVTRAQDQRAWVIDERLASAVGALALVVGAGLLPTWLAAPLCGPLAVLLPGYLLQTRVIRAAIDTPFATWALRVVLSAAVWVVALIAVGSLGVALTSLTPVIIVGIVSLAMALSPRWDASTVTWGTKTLASVIGSAVVVALVTGIGVASVHVSQPPDAPTGIAIATTTESFANVKDGVWTSRTEVINGGSLATSVQVRAISGKSVKATTTVTVPANGSMWVSLRATVGAKPSHLALQALDSDGKPFTRPLTWNRPTVKATPKPVTAAPSPSASATLTPTASNG